MIRFALALEEQVLTTPILLLGSITGEPDPKALPDTNDSVRAIRALQEQIASHVPVKETP